MLADPSVLLRPGILATPLGRLFLALVGIAIVVVIAKVALSVVWRVVSLAVAVVGIVLIAVAYGPL